MSQITLYNFELDDQCYQVRLMLSMLGVDYHAEAIDMMPGEEEKKAPMLALNPRGSLPLLVDGGLTIAGGGAVLAHVAAAHDPDGKWLPRAPAEFGPVMHWLDFAMTVLAGAATARKISLFGLPGHFERLKTEAVAAFRIMDDHILRRQIAGREWFAGETATVADVALFPLFALSRDFGIDHDEFPGLRRWIRRFRALDGFITMPGIPDYH
jgi:glutathione S-transferase